MGLTSECREQREKKKTERMIEIIQSVTKRKHSEKKKKMNRVPETLFKGSNSNIVKTDEKEVRLKN